jgi:Tol biopolymer transport system component
MRYSVYRFACTLLCAIWVGLAWPLPAPAQFKDAPEGGFPPPRGQIAFVRNQSLWLMEADGSKPRELTASGRIGNKVVWSPDNAEILFCQVGLQQYQLPAGGGGSMKLYDLFAVRVGNPGAVKQITDDAMSSTPSYFPDGQKIAFTQNLHTFDFKQEVPLYQVFVSGTYGNPPAKNLNLGTVSPDLQVMAPAVSPDGQTIACAVSSTADITTPKQTIGIAFFPAAGFKGTTAEWTKKAQNLPAATGPAWSPDGRFLAYVDNGTRPRSLGLYDVERDVARTLYTPASGFDLTAVAPSWSADGNWIVFGDVKGFIQIVDRTGHDQRTLTREGTDAYPSFSN